MKVASLGRGDTWAVQAFESGHMPRGWGPSLSPALSTQPCQPSGDSGRRARRVGLAGTAAARTSSTPHRHPGPRPAASQVGQAPGCSRRAHGNLGFARAGLTLTRKQALVPQESLGNRLRSESHRYPSGKNQNSSWKRGQPECKAEKLTRNAQHWTYTVAGTKSSDNCTRSNSAAFG